MITKEENVEWTTIRIEKERLKHEETPGRIRNLNEDAWENLDTWERRDHELIREYLNDAPVRFGERELKAENE